MNRVTLPGSGNPQNQNQYGDPNRMPNRVPSPDPPKKKNKNQPSFFSKYLPSFGKQKNKNTSYSFPKPPIALQQGPQNLRNEDRLSPVLNMKKSKDNDDIHNRKSNSGTSNQKNFGWRGETSTFKSSNNQSFQSAYNPYYTSSSDKNQWAPSSESDTTPQPHYDYSVPMPSFDNESIPSENQKKLYHQASDLTGTISVPNNDSLNAIMHRDDLNNQAYNKAVDSNENHHRFDNEDRQNERDYRLKKEVIKRLSQPALTKMIASEQIHRQQQEKKANAMQYIAQPVNQPNAIQNISEEALILKNAQACGIDITTRPIQEKYISGMYNERINQYLYHHSMLFSGVSTTSNKNGKLTVKFYDKSDPFTFKTTNGWSVKIIKCTTFPHVRLIRFFLDETVANKSSCGRLCEYFNC